MKQIYLILGLLILLSSCNSNPPESGKHITSVEGLDFEMIVIDGCEYLRRSAGYAGYLAHKGNCTNPIHIYKPGPNQLMLDQLKREMDSLSLIINSY